MTNNKQREEYRHLDRDTREIVEILDGLPPLNPPIEQRGVCCKKCTDYDNEGGGSCANHQCKCHATPPIDNNEDWIKEFDEKFGMKEFHDEFVAHGTYTKDIKSFIKALLEKERDLGRKEMKEEIMKLLENLKEGTGISTNGLVMEFRHAEEIRRWNQKVEDLINLLQNK